ncbi:MAG: signal recognition particle protein [Nitrospinota bacterium]
MFKNLSDKLEVVVDRLKGIKRLTEANIEDSLSATKTALLDADVNLHIVKDFISRIRAKAIGEKSIKSLTTGQTLINIVHKELIALLGETASDINFEHNKPTKILIAGLQGSGKTTTLIKLAKKIKSKGYQPLVVSTDIYRPAAILQLEQLAKLADIKFFQSSQDQDPLQIVRESVASLGKEGANVLLIDTAGRLGIDEKMIAELKAIQSLLCPSETLFVADAMTGQTALNSAEAFHKACPLTGIILTKLDGDTRGGAALSIKQALNIPIKFIGVGEKIDQFEEFHPDRIAGRILGMGDILTLIEQTESKLDLEEAAKLAKKNQQASFNLEDFLKQIKMAQSLGPIDQLVKMVPGLGSSVKLKSMPTAKDLKRIEAIISSMTRKERKMPAIVNISRKKRIAKGAGVSILDVNKLLKNFQKAKKMMKMFGKKQLKNFNIPSEFEGLN